MRRDSNCIFCRIIAGEIPGSVIYDDEHVIAFRDIEPSAPTHVLITPREHIRSLHDIQEVDNDIIAAVAHAAQRVAEIDGIAERGYRLVTNVGVDGGQSVDHLHFHVLGGRLLGPLG